MANLATTKIVDLLPISLQGDASVMAAATALDTELTAVTAAIEECLLLPRLVGHLKAAELLLLAEAIDAEEALRLGLANKVVAADVLLPFAREQGLKLAAKPPRALQKSKALLKQELKQAVHFVIDLEARAFAQALQGEEAQNRIASKLQKRR